MTLLEQSADAIRLGTGDPRRIGRRPAAVRQLASVAATLAPDRGPAGRRGRTAACQVLTCRLRTWRRPLTCSAS